jgi:hypothetical protein
VTYSRSPAPYSDRRIQRLGSRHGRGAGAVTPEVAARRPAAIAWLWSWALLGALCSLPAALVALRSPSDGLALALGCIPAAAVGARGGRRSRVAVLVVGLCIGLGLVLGAALSTFWLLAAGGIFVLALGAAVVSAHARVGSLLMTLAVPMVGAGLSFDGDVEAAAGVAALMAVGAVYGWLLCLCWPEEPVTAPAHAALPGQATMVEYGVRLGLAGAVCAALGFALDLGHKGWGDRGMPAGHASHGRDDPAARCRSSGQRHDRCARGLCARAARGRRVGDRRRDRRSVDRAGCDAPVPVVCHWRIHVVHCDLATGLWSARGSGAKIRRKSG